MTNTHLPSLPSPKVTINNDEITLTIYRPEATIDIAYQRDNGTLAIAAFDPDTNDPQALRCHRFDLSPEEVTALKNHLNHPDIH